MGLDVRKGFTRTASQAPALTSLASEGPSVATLDARRGLLPGRATSVCTTKGTDHGASTGIMLSSASSSSGLGSKMSDCVQDLGCTLEHRGSGWITVGCDEPTRGVDAMRKCVSSKLVMEETSPRRAGEFRHGELNHCECNVAFLLPNLTGLLPILTDFRTMASNRASVRLQYAQRDPRPNGFVTNGISPEKCVKPLTSRLIRGKRRAPSGSPGRGFHMPALILNKFPMKSIRFANLIRMDFAHKNHERTLRRSIGNHGILAFSASTSWFHRQTRAKKNQERRIRLQVHGYERTGRCRADSSSDPPRPHARSDCNDGNQIRGPRATAPATSTR